MSTRSPVCRASSTTPGSSRDIDVIATERRTHVHGSPRPRRTCRHVSQSLSSAGRHDARAVQAFDPACGHRQARVARRGLALASGCSIVGRICPHVLPMSSECRRVPAGAWSVAVVDLGQASGARSSGASSQPCGHPPHRHRRVSPTRADNLLGMAPPRPNPNPRRPSDRPNALSSRTPSR